MAANQCQQNYKMSDKEIKVPNIGEFKDVEVIEVLVSNGQSVSKNDPLITIESDKSSVEIPSTVSGKVESVNVKVSDKVSKGDILLSIESSKENLSEKPIPKDTESIIKQAESVLKNEKKEATTEQNPVGEKKQTIIQVTNENDIDPLETQDWLESLSADKDSNQS